MSSYVIYRLFEGAEYMWYNLMKYIRGETDGYTRLYRRRFTRKI